MAETWKKIKTFYNRHRAAIWRYGSACALVAVGYLLDREWMGVLGGLPLIAGYGDDAPPIWLDRPLMSAAEFNADVAANGGARFSYEMYRNWWYNNSELAKPSDPDLPDPSAFTSNIGYDINIMSEAGQNALQTFMSMVPGAQEFMEFYLPHIQKMMEAQPEAYPMGFDLEAGDTEKRLKQMQMARLGQIPDLAAAYEGAYENYLPAYKRRYEENTLKPAQEQLAALGLDTSSAGMDYVGKLGEDQAITEAALWQDMQLGKASAQQQMFGLEDQQLGAAWDMSGREAQRQYDTQRMQYADWLRQTGQQAELASMLGTPTYNTMLGSMTNVFNTGQSGAASLGSSMMGAQSGLASTMYNAQANAAMTQWESNFMAPYLNMANQPVKPSSGK